MNKFSKSIKSIEEIAKLSKGCWPELSRRLEELGEVLKKEAQEEDAWALVGKLYYNKDTGEYYLQNKEPYKI